MEFLLFLKHTTKMAQDKVALIFTAKERQGIHTQFHSLSACHCVKLYHCCPTSFLWFGPWVVMPIIPPQVIQLMWKISKSSFPVSFTLTKPFTDMYNTNISHFPTNVATENQRDSSVMFDVKLGVNVLQHVIEKHQESNQTRFHNKTAQDAGKMQRLKQMVNRLI